MKSIFRFIAFVLFLFCCTITFLPIVFIAITVAEDGYEDCILYKMYIEI